MIRLALAVFFAFPATANATEQFDLVCEGTTKSSGYDLSGEQFEHFSYRYRVDLQQKKFCRDQCKALIDIEEVQPQFLVFSAKNRDRDPRLEMTEERVDRVSGEYSSSYFPPRGRLGYSVSTGKCEPTEFTGFPKPAVKF